MQGVKRVRIEIGGAAYNVTTSEDEDRVKELAAEISGDVDALFVKNPALSMNDALVLCALGYLDEYKKESTNSDHIRSQLKDYLGDTAKARMETDEALRRAERAEKELAEFKKRYGTY